MQSRCLPVETVVRGARWGLPWICVLAISTCLAYAMAVAVAGGSYAGDSLTTITVVPAEIASTTTPASIDRLSSDDACATRGPMLYVGLSSWIHDPNVPCHDDAP